MSKKIRKGDQSLIEKRGKLHLPMKKNIFSKAEHGGKKTAVTRRSFVSKPNICHSISCFMVPFLPQTTKPNLNNVFYSKILNSWEQIDFPDSHREKIDHFNNI